jgi:hypothetical protein
MAYFLELVSQKIRCYLFSWKTMIFQMHDKINADILHFKFVSCYWQNMQHYLTPSNIPLQFCLTPRFKVLFGRIDK